MVAARWVHTNDEGITMAKNANELYVANENGDWWVITPGSVLYVLRPEDMPEGASDADDKFEDVIMENGTVVEELFDDLVKIANS